jgi:hypothetical protein
MFYRLNNCYLEVVHISNSINIKKIFSIALFNLKLKASKSCVVRDRKNLLTIYLASMKPKVRKQSFQVFSFSTCHTDVNNGT